jgi:hypothetical protein
MIYNFGKTTSSHVPVLKEFINKFNPEKVIEFGAGAFSTGVFLESCKSVLSIETHIQWAEFIQRRFSSCSGYLIKRLDIDKVLKYAKGIKEKYDISFVDTQNKIRVQLIQASAKFTDTIICHDTQVPFLKNVIVPGYERVMFTKAPFPYKNHTRPYTTLWTRREDVYTHFRTLDETQLYKMYKYPYGIKK